ncbi:uncharacterized protein BXZ73DRAFT_98766 [Epithele typhae]|uniref:uncharacterized protein n=1 Tax=Epithele typhae TaxID=378194 RepID=UPI002008E232|nr:uncharacterized protein BXZ73DRAFT_98766 [Epithele typhae]KAH9940938.1 hypothetical protein BXZ73DRAFT_98766 [Epithele typhae]
MSQYHLFSLPPELLDTLVLRNALGHAPEPALESRPSTPPPITSAQPSTGSRACNVCLGAKFADVDDQRAHFRSDWHRYNVKVRLTGGEPVSEFQFTQLVDGLEDSLSGSASSSESDTDESDAVSALVYKTRRKDRPSSPSVGGPSIPQMPLVWFHSPPATQIGVYRTIFSTIVSPQDYLEELESLQDGGEHGRTWALFMTAGGHFAGAIVRVKRPDGDDPAELTKKGKPKRPKPDVEILKHKTFHRYTTRRKQGGSQGLNDNSKSKAISAGAMLRRYGEQALRDDIRKLLEDWAEDLHECERIWLRASVSNRRIFLDYDDAVIKKGDVRLRSFPFPTRRPTQAELTRCLNELVRVKVSHLTEDALRAQDEALLASLPKPKPQPAPPTQPDATKLKEKPVIPQLSAEEERIRDRWTRLLDMVKRGRLDALRSFWEREGADLGGVDTSVPGWADERGGTVLQAATLAGQEDVTASTALDEEPVADEDPETARLPRGKRRTAYDLAKTKEMRNLYRRCAAEHPDWWDWLGSENGARIPSVLSTEMKEVQDEKKKARRKGLKDKVKEREKERASASPTPPPVAAVKPVKEEPQSGPRKLGGAAGAAEGVAGLTPEMRAKIERERRARAAEARMKALGGGRP